MKRPKPIQGIRKFVYRKRPAINEVLREPTAGGIVFRRNAETKAVEILLIQDAKNRWTIPKGHIEEGESAKQTAKREICEETGLKEMDVLNWLGKINFQYRRQQSLVLMTTEIFLVRALGDEHPDRLQHVRRDALVEPAFAAHALPLEIPRELGVRVGVRILEVDVDGVVKRLAGSNR